MRKPSVEDFTWLIEFTGALFFAELEKISSMRTTSEKYSACSMHNAKRYQTKEVGQTK
jgi:hypothetical protein